MNTQNRKSTPKRAVQNPKYPVPPRSRNGQRIGYTTGSNAAAAAKAATIALLTGGFPETVTITLPIGETATMTPVERELTTADRGPQVTNNAPLSTVSGQPSAVSEAYCCMVKDAGDDPDVTHGALICALVRSSPTPGITLEGGEGVGRVTLPGLGLEVGGPAINPVPRQQIRNNVADAVREVKPDEPDFLGKHGLEVIISVPDGAELAQKTLNSRLGILGGISILGTTGKVFPYSTAAWRASVIQAVEVAAKNSVEKVVLATGNRSEGFAMRIFPELPEVAFVELSVFTGDALKTCIAHGVQAVVFVGMMGKMVKTAQGHMTTHVAGNQVDFGFLAQVCRETGAPDELIQAVAAANTGRHFLELCQQWEFYAPVQRIVDLALNSCEKFIRDNGGTMELEVILVDFDGTVLARAKGGQVHESGTPSLNAVPLVQRLSADPAHSYDDESVMGAQRSRGAKEQG
ncbi:MAG: cobalt-precorrin-5B (C(1))-methyltransferase [Anaerolineales bacterium]|nr:cobalt-precorrin-5B (C(1))-methyltransferase [Anaerolineales bacterium]